MTVLKTKRVLVLLGLFAAVILPTCTAPGGAGLNPGPTSTPTSTLTPTVTPVPLALSVNGEGIPQADFDAELARYQAAQVGVGKTVSQADAVQAVQDDLIDTLLLSQGAAGYNHSVDDATLQARIDKLAAQVGGAQALADWESSHGYTEAGFRQALRRQIAAAWMRDQILASVPTTTEQVHVKQILLYNAEEAQGVLERLKAGADFKELAAQYDPVTQGELGWFPRGYLPETAIEEAAFSLQPGQYSQVIQTPTGYHILLLQERDPARTLSPDALLTLQEHAVQDWLRQRRQESKIVLTP